VESVCLPRAAQGYGEYRGNMQGNKGKPAENGERRIDPHVHCGDGRTIRDTKRLEERQGVKIVFDMLNKDHPITTSEMVMDRLAVALHEIGSLYGYYLYVGITGDPKQAKEAAKIVETYPRVIGAEMLAGMNDDSQRRAYETLASPDVNYKGVLAVHCGYESPGRADSWIPEKASEMEAQSVKKQIELAWETGFTGHLHICNASTPQTVMLVDEAIRDGMRISCGATPYHLLHSTADVRTAGGTGYEAPAPKDREEMLGLRELLRQGKIDWIETNNTPRTGARAPKEYKHLLREMKKWGVSKERIQELTCSNILAVFPKVAVVEGFPIAEAQA